MRRKARCIWRLVVAGTLMCAVVSPASAIILHAWTFEELAAASDEVLLVQHLVARDTGRRTKWPLPGSRFSSSPIDKAEWESTLRVLLRIRAPREAPSPLNSAIRLRYYRKVDQRGCVNCIPEIDFSADEGNYYLVFLKRVAPDQYEPASGDDTPVDSVFNLRHTGGGPIQWEVYLPSPPPR